jgi:sugar lactone lactonase YvrE
MVIYLFVKFHHSEMKKTIYKKKPILLSLSLFFVISYCLSQGVGIGNTTPNEKAIVDITSTTQGLLIPRMTNVQKLGINSPPVGLLVYQIDGTKGIYHYNSLRWLNLTYGISSDDEGFLYGDVITIAGHLLGGDYDANGLEAAFFSPAGVALDLSGNLYIAEIVNNKIRKLSPDGQVTTFAGSGTPGSTDGNADVASFNYPVGVVVDNSGNVYVADRDNNKIRKITPGGIVSTLAGTGSYGSDDGAGEIATFYNPSGIAVDNSGYVYVADLYNNKIRKISPSGEVTTLAGNGMIGSDDGPGNTATFKYPTGVTVDNSGNVYVADRDNQKIRKITSAGLVSTLAGTGDIGSKDGNGTTATFSMPTGISIDAFGFLYVLDQTSNKMRKVSPAGIVSTVAGKGTQGHADGSSSTATFSYPIGIATDKNSSNGVLYVGDTDSNMIRKITPTE